MVNMANLYAYIFYHNKKNTMRPCRLMCHFYFRLRNCGDFFLFSATLVSQILLVIDLFDMNRPTTVISRGRQPQVLIFT